MQSVTEIVLASASPRRCELLALLEIPFRVEPSRYHEMTPDAPVTLPDFVMDLAEGKAREVSDRLNARCVLAADTEVSLTQDIGMPLGKPRDAEDAARMLAALSGREHFVYTGVAWVPQEPDDVIHRACVVTRVRFRRLTDAMIARYIATGEPMDKAGAYGAQGYAAPFIESIEGDYFNVVGLPLCEVGKLLERSGLQWGAIR